MNSEQKINLELDVSAAAAGAATAAAKKPRKPATKGVKVSKVKDELKEALENDIKDIVSNLEKQTVVKAEAKNKDVKPKTVSKTKFACEGVVLKKASPELLKFLNETKNKLSTDSLKKYFDGLINALNSERITPDFEVTLTELVQFYKASLFFTTIPYFLNNENRNEKRYLETDIKSITTLRNSLILQNSEIVSRFGMSILNTVKEESNFKSSDIHHFDNDLNIIDYNVIKKTIENSLQFVKNILNEVAPSIMETVFYSYVVILTLLSVLDENDPKNKFVKDKCLAMSNDTNSFILQVSKCLKSKAKPKEQGERSATVAYKVSKTVDEIYSPKPGMFDNDNMIETPVEDDDSADNDNEVEE